ncbi:MAG: AMP-binding protein [Verrucomicrobiota bacterium]
MSMTDHQLQELNQLLRLLRASNPFYQQRLAEAGVKDDLLSLDAFYNKVPLTTKAEILADRKAHLPYGSNLTMPLAAYNRYCQTSATSGGEPIIWLDTEEGWSWMLDNWQMVYDASGVTGDDRIFFAFSFGPFLGFWTAFEAAHKLGCLCIPGGAMSTRMRLDVMLRNKATVLCCTPTYALRLTEVAREEGILLNNLSVQKIIVAGEPGGSSEAFRAKLQHRWPEVEVMDHYGMTEVGPVGVHYDDEEQACLRLLDDRYIVEVIDKESGQHVANGQEGELVLTPLGRTASPVLRYKTGDYVKLLRKDNMTLLPGGVLGRVDDMVIVRGVNLYPQAVDDVVHSIEGIAEYRVLVTKSNEMVELEIEIEVMHGFDAKALAILLQEAMEQAFSLRIPVKLHEGESWPRFEMKAKRWLFNMD